MKAFSVPTPSFPSASSVHIMQHGIWKWKYFSKLFEWQHLGGKDIFYTDYKILCHSPQIKVIFQKKGLWLKKHSSLSFKSSPVNIIHSKMTGDGKECNQTCNRPRHRADIQVVWSGKSTSSRHHTNIAHSVTLNSQRNRVLKNERRRSGRLIYSVDCSVQWSWGRQNCTQRSVCPSTHSTCLQRGVCDFESHTWTRQSPLHGRQQLCPVMCITCNANILYW